MTHMIDSNYAPCPQRRVSLWSRLSRIRDLYRQRRDLAALDPHLLADVGLSSQQAKTEADRPLWDAPASWRC